ncbi:MAG: metallophosphoesterase [Cyanobacteria bacterium P01_G01_bin.49]
MVPIHLEPLKVERISVAIADLPLGLVGIKLIHLSDFHYDGLRLSEELLQEAIAISNLENPDLILLTGDYITDQPDPIDELALRLQSLKSRSGIYAVLGNHDCYRRNAKARVIKALNGIGVNVLWNQIATPFGTNFPIVGLADFWSSEFNPAAVMTQLAPNIPRLVLSHNPDTAAILQQWRVDLQLSGHTHGGQVTIPGLGTAAFFIQQMSQYTPRILHPCIPFVKDCSKVVKNWQWAEGWHQLHYNQLYVNRGLGTYFPGRFFCPPELTVITLRSQVAY